VPLISRIYGKGRVRIMRENLAACDEDYAARLADWLLERYL
jgi:hypothetical protein